MDGIDFVNDPVALAMREDVDVVVELIGGEDGPALALVEAAIANGKPVITANKALLARHGSHVAASAEAAAVSIAAEAAVAGGIPCLKMIREGLAGNRISRISGILNGTCNYILTTMEATGRDFDDVLKEAQDLVMPKLTRALISMVSMRRINLRCCRRSVSGSSLISMRSGSPVSAR